MPQIKYCRFDNSLLVPLVSKPAQNSHGRLRWHLHPGWGEGLTWLSSCHADRAVRAASPCPGCALNSAASGKKLQRTARPCVRGVTATAAALPGEGFVRRQYPLEVPAGTNLWLGNGAGRSRSDPQRTGRKPMALCW